LKEENKTTTTFFFLLLLFYFFTLFTIFFFLYVEFKCRSLRHFSPKHEKFYINFSFMNLNLGLKVDYGNSLVKQEKKISNCNDIIHEIAKN